MDLTEEETKDLPPLTTTLHSSRGERRDTRNRSDVDRGRGSGREKGGWETSLHSSLLPREVIGGFRKSTYSKGPMRLDSRGEKGKVSHAVDLS